MVIFNLKYEAGSKEAEAFLKDVHQLTLIPVVKQFRAFRLRPNNPFDYGISMMFDNQADYNAYIAHPVHHEVEQTHWRSAATHSLVIDYDV